MQSALVPVRGEHKLQSVEEWMAPSCFQSPALVMQCCKKMLKDSGVEVALYSSKVLFNL